MRSLGVKKIVAEMNIIAPARNNQEKADIADACSIPHVNNKDNNFLQVRICKT